MKKSILLYLSCFCMIVGLSFSVNFDTEAGCWDCDNFVPVSYCTVTMFGGICGSNYNPHQRCTWECSSGCEVCEGSVFLLPN